MLPPAYKQLTDQDWLYAQFDGLHLLIEEPPEHVRLRLIEPLSPLQTRTLQLIEMSPKIDDLSFTKRKFIDSI